MKIVLVFSAIVALTLGAPHPRDLNGDLAEIIALIPVDDILAIAKEHGKNDPAFQSVVVYLKGDEWSKVVKAVASNPKWQELKAWLTDAGLPIQALIDAIHALIADAEISGEGDGNASLRPLLDEIEAIIPTDKMLELITKKLVSSPDFKKLYVKLSSDDTRALVEDVRAMPEVQTMAEKLKNMDVHVDEALAWIYEFLGWGKPKVTMRPRDLNGDLAEIIALIPVDEILAIAKEHGKNDPAFQSVVVYLKGDEWSKVVKAVASNPKWQELKAWLTDAGLPIQALIDAIHALIADAEISGEGDGNASLRPLLDEIEAIIPTDEMLKLINKKLVSSPDFKQLYVKLSSDDTRALIEDVRAMPEVQTMAEKLKNMDVHVDEALAWIYEFLGWGKPKVAMQPRDLNEDLAEIIALIPVDDILAIAKEHGKNDPAFQSVVVYLKGDEWSGVVKAVASNPRWKELKAWLTVVGLPIQDYIDAIHGLIANAEITGEGDGNASLRPLLDEIEAIIPSDEILQLINEKLDSSPEFKELYAKLSSDDTRALVDEVGAIPEVQTIATQLTKMGVHVEEALAWIYKFLGWE